MGMVRHKKSRKRKPPKCGSLNVLAKQVDGLHMLLCVCADGVCECHAIGTKETSQVGNDASGPILTAFGPVDFAETA